MTATTEIIIVTGSRTFTDWDALCDALDKHDPSEVWSGGARGADTFARRWALLNHRRYREFLPDWATLGKRAGMIRNAEMMSRAPATAIVLAFPRGPLGSSAGTCQAVECARREGLKVKVLNQW